jgi:hypothetical protein
MLLGIQPIEERCTQAFRQGPELITSSIEEHQQSRICRVSHVLPFLSVSSYSTNPE